MSAWRYIYGIKTWSGILHEHSPRGLRIMPRITPLRLRACNRLKPRFGNPSDMPNSRIGCLRAVRRPLPLFLITGPLFQNTDHKRRQDISLSAETHHYPNGQHHVMSSNVQDSNSIYSEIRYRQMISVALVPTDTHHLITGTLFRPYDQPS